VKEVAFTDLAEDGIYYESQQTLTLQQQFISPLCGHTYIFLQVCNSNFWTANPIPGNDCYKTLIGGLKL
jgi:hypothetical protein